MEKCPETSTKNAVQEFHFWKSDRSCNHPTTSAISPVTMHRSLQPSQENHTVALATRTDRNFLVFRRNSVCFAAVLSHAHIEVAYLLVTHSLTTLVILAIHSQPWMKEVKGIRHGGGGGLPTLPGLYHSTIQLS